ncbi:MAG: uridine kinase, partial [Candidatus Rokuibacteriota bacterium]
LARAMAAALGGERPVSHLAQDAYYRDRGDLPPAARAEVNYDAPEAFDAVLLHAHLAALRAGEPVCPPRYCFTTHRRLGEGPPLPPGEVVLVDGILVLHDPAVRSALDLKIFVDAPPAVRLARRIARDTAERGRTRASVIAQFTATVGAAHVAWVEPTKALADVIILNAGGPAAIAEIAASAVRTHLRKRRETQAA